MCTVTWIQQDDGYTLFCNRDERRARTIAAGPRILRSEGVRFVAPLDGDAGGTWLAANEYGVTCCLLNGTKPRKSRPGIHLSSRGLLVLDLAVGRTAAAVAERFRRLDLARFAPFVLAVLEPGRAASVVEWDMESVSRIQSGECLPLLASSSFDAGGVRAARKAELARLAEEMGLVGEKLLHELHRSHGPGASAYSPCMHRPDAETVSFSRIRVTAREMEFHYQSGSPCEGRRPEMRRLPRREAFLE